MKAKMQAQRKFAQGAFIPPSNTAIHLDKIDLPPNKDKDKGDKIFNSNLSVSRVLDFVSMQGVHIHQTLEPIVLVERIDNKTPKKRHESINQPVPVPSTSHSGRMEVSEIDGLPSKKKRSIRNKPIKSPIFTSPKTEMCTRSNAKRLEKRRATQLMTRRMADIDSTSTDDDVPLNVFTKHIFTKKLDLRPKLAATRNTSVRKRERKPKKGKQSHTLVKAVSEISYKIGINNNGQTEVTGKQSHTSVEAVSEISYKIGINNNGQTEVTGKEDEALCPIMSEKNPFDGFSNDDFVDEDINDDENVLLLSESEVSVASNTHRNITQPDEQISEPLQGSKVNDTSGNFLQHDEQILGEPLQESNKNDRIGIDIQLDEEIAVPLPETNMNYTIGNTQIDEQPIAEPLEGSKRDDTIGMVTELDRNITGEVTQLDANILPEPSKASNNMPSTDDATCVPSNYTEQHLTRSKFKLTDKSLEVTDLPTAAGETVLLHKNYDDLLATTTLIVPPSGESNIVIDIDSDSSCNMEVDVDINELSRNNDVESDNEQPNEEKEVRQSVPRKRKLVPQKRQRVPRQRQPSKDDAELMTNRILRKALRDNACSREDWPSSGMTFYLDAGFINQSDDVFAFNEDDTTEVSRCRRVSQVEKGEFFIVVNFPDPKCGGGVMRACLTKTVDKDKLISRHDFEKTILRMAAADELEEADQNKGRVTRRRNWRSTAPRHKGTISMENADSTSCSVPRSPLEKDNLLKCQPMTSRDSEKPSKTWQQIFSQSDIQPGTSKQSAPCQPNAPRSLEAQPWISEAPVYKPSREEFEDPFEYISKITPDASQYGIIKIVPPVGFNPPCLLNDVIKFATYNQYPDKMLNRWGLASREVTTIRAHLIEQKITFNKSPTVEGLEVNLIKLHNSVKQLGGVSEVNDKNKWPRVVDAMNYPRDCALDKKLKTIYYKLLLPYDSMQLGEKLVLRNKVEQQWANHLRCILKRSQNPLHKQRLRLGETDSSDEETESGDLAKAVKDADECVVSGKQKNIEQFKKVAKLAKVIHFPGNPNPSVEQVEEKYWKLVTHGTEQVCVISAAIDTGDSNFGFPKQKGDEYSKHPWNLKMLNNHPQSILRPMGAVLSVTVPTLNLGTVFTTSCWHRDPHSLPWIEYMHSGAPKIWYGIPDSQTTEFRKAMDVLCPAYCQNKPIWLPSEVAMIPPCMFENHNVTLTKVVQNPGEFVIIFPKAYSCSICTDFTVSESVYFATQPWLQDAINDFKTARESCEPTMFSLEHLMLSMASDMRFPNALLPTLTDHVDIMIREERKNRRTLMDRGVPMKVMRHGTIKKTTTWNIRAALSECDLCRSMLYLSKVERLTSKNSVHCLRHALQLLDLPWVSDKHNGTLICHVSQHVLDDNMHELNSRNRALYPADDDFEDDREEESDE